MFLKTNHSTQNNNLPMTKYIIVTIYISNPVFSVSNYNKLLSN